MTATPQTPPTPPTPETPETPPTPAPVVALVSLSIMITGTTWPFIVAVLAPVLREELGFSATLLGVAYGIYYLSGSLWSTLAGRLVDRGGFRVAGAVLIAVSVAQHVTLATSRGWLQLAVSGAIGGLGLALANPVTNTLIGTQLKGRAARSVVGVKQTGVPFSAVFAGTVTPAAATALGWRGSVLATLMMSVLAVLLLLAVRGSSGATAAGAARPQLRHRFGIERYVFAMGIIAAGVNGYLVLFVVDVFQGSVQRAGALAATLALSGAIGRILWASIGGGARTLPILRTLGTTGALALVAFATLTFEPGIWVAGIVFGLTIHAWQGLGMVAVIEADSSGTIGAATARVMRDFYVGFVIGAPLSGFVIDRLGFTATWAMLAVVALLAALSLSAPVDAPAERG